MRTRINRPPPASTAAGRVSQRLAGAAIAVLLGGAALFGTAWALGGEDAVSDNWVGRTVAAAIYLGVVGSGAALVTAVLAGLRREPWHQLWLPLATFPAVVVVIGLLEAFVLE